MADQRSGASVSPGPCFIQRCRVCGKEIRTEWGPEVHEESRYALRRHIDAHGFETIYAYGRQEALRGT